MLGFRRRLVFSRHVVAYMFLLAFMWRFVGMVDAILVASAAAASAARATGDLVSVNRLGCQKASLYECADLRVDDVAASVDVLHCWMNIHITSATYNTTATYIH